MKLNTILLAGAAMIAANGAQAKTFKNAATGIAHPTATITFEGQKDGADLSTAYAAEGVTFSGLSATTIYGSDFKPTKAPAAINFGSRAVVNDFSISFAKPITDFSAYLVTNGAGTTISSYLGSALVSSIKVGAYNGASSFQGFTDTDIDRVVFDVSGDHLALIDNVSFKAAVPEPATWAMMLMGFGMMGMGLRYRRKGTQVRFA